MTQRFDDRCVKVGETNRLIVVASRSTIVKAINKFNSGYHNDYRLVRMLAKEYLAEPIRENVASLAVALRTVLEGWGAGKRKAPNVQELAALEAALLNPEFSALLVGFTNREISTLRVKNGTSRLIGNSADKEQLEEFDKRLILVLNAISKSFLIANTNVTYPLKVLLLLTGFMPAFDSQVRSGLARAGFPGIKSNQFLLPSVVNRPQGKKLAHLPFYLGECFASNEPLLRSAVVQSDYPWLVNEPGRLLDILFFMQGSTDSTLIKFSTVFSGWKALS